MRIKLAWLLGVLSVANGLFMLFAPAAWYLGIPGVASTGPFNQHFVRDIGGAYLTAGGALIWFALDVRARPAVLAAAGFFVLHALVHLGDALGGRESWDHVMADVPTIYFSALLTLWIAWPPSVSTTEERSNDQMAVTEANRRV
ncbi:MAG TPA: hypothetical protein VKB84_13700 [Candidatus Binataceae bacterium]|nr:hypothetical protein [Candidatus Binataceae bacterium]